MSQWTKTGLRRLIVDSVSPVVSGVGFRFKKASEAFVRRIDGGRQELGLPLVDYNPVFEFSFTLCIRLELVQETTNRFSGSPPKYHSTTMTSITQLEFLGLPAEPGRGVRFRVESEPELAAVMPGVLNIVRERVLPFFDEYCDVASVNRGLNPDGAERVFRIVGFPNQRAFDATNQPYRAMAGIAVAHLANDPRLPELIRAYRSQISGMQEHDRAKFDNLANYISGRAGSQGVALDLARRIECSEVGDACCMNGVMGKPTKSGHRFETRRALYIWSVPEHVRQANLPSLQRWAEETFDLERSLPLPRTIRWTVFRNAAALEPLAAGRGRRDDELPRLKRQGQSTFGGDAIDGGWSGFDSE